jgi:hypothetical protein
MHISLIQDTFPLHFEEIAMDFSTADAFYILKSDQRTYLKSLGLKIDVVLYKAP